MAAPAPPAPPVGPDTLVTVKVLYNDANRRFKIPLRDLGARVFPQKVRVSTSPVPGMLAPTAREELSAATAISITSIFSLYRVSFITIAISMDMDCFSLRNFCLNSSFLSWHRPC